MNRALVMVVSAWVLWSNVSTGGPQVWSRLAVSDTKNECERNQAVMVEAMHTVTDRMRPDPRSPGIKYERAYHGAVGRHPDGKLATWITYDCLPDTIDPRRP